MPATLKERKLRKRSSSLELFGRRHFAEDADIDNVMTFVDAHGEVVSPLLPPT